MDIMTWLDKVKLGPWPVTHRDLVMLKPGHRALTRDGVLDAVAISTSMVVMVVLTKTEQGWIGGESESFHEYLESQERYWFYPATECSPVTMISPCPMTAT